MLIRTKENTFLVRFQDGRERSFIKGTTLLEIMDLDRPPESRTIVLAKVNNRIRSLHNRIDENCRIEWLTVRTMEGIRAYQQTLCLVLIKAVQELYPKHRLLIDHSLGKGLYCEFKNGRSTNRTMIRRIEKRMRQIIRNDEPIQPVEMTRTAFGEYLRKKAGELTGEERTHITVFRCGNATEYLGYPLFPSTGKLKAFGLRAWPPGMILRFSEETNFDRLSAFTKPKNLFRVFNETRKWENILHIESTAEINRAAEFGALSDLIKIAEGFHEKKIAAIADAITRRSRKLRVVLIAGPSSSGKTTFAKRLSIQLRVNGLVPLALSTDDYFMDNEKAPRDALGNPDFESIHTLDIPRFNADHLALKQGRNVHLPRFDFKTGKRIPGPHVQIGKDSPVLIEGLHALNESLTTLIPSKNKFKVYVSALTQLNISDSLRVSTSDVRLIRRLVRDSLFRNHSASFTLSTWQQVRAGEEKYIFPFQEEADVIFNSSLMYEPSILRGFVQPLLEKVPGNSPAYPEAQRMLEFLFFFKPVPSTEVLSNSILREFIGGSSFEY